MRRLRWATLFALLTVLALVEPHSFRFFARHAVRAEAWRHGVEARIGAVEGSLFEPLRLRDSVWIYESAGGPVTRLEAASATAEFSWRHLLPRSSGRWFQRLTIQDLTGKLQFPLETSEAKPAVPNGLLRLPRPAGRWLPAPERIEARGADFIFQNNGDYVRLTGADFSFSAVEPGVFRASQIAIKQPWLQRTFRDVTGATAMQGTKVEVAQLTFEPGVELLGFSAEIDALARGQWNLDMRLAAFDGDLRVSAKTLPEERLFAFEATGRFLQINLAKLAVFLGASDAAGGTIKEGHFNFRGPPQQLARATARLRLEATNFQWESRQWDALVLGATLMNGRVQIPELALAQGRNRLNLNGELPLPTPGVAWWQTEFHLNIAAKIDNLTELSALLLPEFQFAAGKANLDGSIRGKSQQFNGQFIVSGKDLKWHDAPLEELHAAVRIEGNELELTNLAVFNHGDSLRGHGVVNIIGDKQYWGEIHAAIDDLALYAALLEKPILPEPLAGGASLAWSGEGSARGHSGKFSARLRKLRPLGATAALLHPINAEFDGTYASGAMLFSRFLLADDESSFTAKVGVGNKALSLQGIKLYHRQALWLEGDALLPLDIWNAWPNTSLATLLDTATVSKINLTANHLGLREASRLTGWKFPIEGVVAGNFVAEGPLDGLKTSGQLALSKAVIPLGWSGEMLTGVEGEAAFEGSTMLVKTFTGRHAAGDFAASGQIDLRNVREPALQLALTSEKTVLTVFPQAPAPPRASVAARLQVAGPLSAATLSGEAQLLSFAADRPDLRSSQNGTPLPPVFAPFASAPWSAWKFDVALRTPQPAPVHWREQREQSDSWSLGPQTLAANLRLTGTGQALALVGEAVFRGGTVMANDAPLWLEEATWSFREGFPRDPSLTAVFRDRIFEKEFAEHVTGTWQHPMRFFVFAPPLTEALIRAKFSRPATQFREPLGMELRVPPEFFPGVHIAEWPPIATPAPLPPAAPPAPTPPKPAVPVPAPVPGR